MKKWMIFPLVLSLLLTVGCADQNIVDKPKDNVTKPVASKKDEKMFSDRDHKTQYAEGKSVRIQFDGNTATASSNSVSVEGSTVTITSEQTYILSGNLDNGTVIIDAGENDKPQLVLEGVTVNSDTIALEILEADKVFITLAEGTENRLSASDTAVHSKQDLTFNGSGSLTVTSTASHGITCKDDLVFTGGRYQIQSASHGLDANDSVRITGDTTLTLDTGKDGIHCENQDDSELGFVYIEHGNLKITAQGDGISAGAYAYIADGSFDITAGGGSVNGNKEQSDFFGGFMGGGGGRPSRPRAAQTSTSTQDSTSMKGIKATGDITLDGGGFTMDTADDAIHSNNAIAVNGGTFELSTGDDAFHAEETLTVHAGILNVKTSYEALEAHKVHILGGELELHAKDDGINAAGGQDQSGTEGGRDGMFGGGRPGGHFGGSSDGLIEVSGGKLKIYASGDCMDANGSITISGGEIYATNPTSGDTSVLDSDNGAMITGGNFIGAAASTMMAQSFDQSSTQGVLAGTVGSQKAGTLVTVTDTAGNTLVSFEAEYDFVLVILTTPEMKKGETYTLTVGELTHTAQAA